MYETGFKLTLLILALVTEMVQSFIPINFLRDVAQSRKNVFISPVLTPVDRIRALGYPAESYQVVTDDGYILQLDRIPYGISNTVQPRPVVLLMHCLLCSSVDWLLNSPDRALGFYLADNGYDVWMMNARGNKFSRNHVSLSPESKSFWQFSWHEMGVYDLPACIDKALEISGTDQLSYVGFSTAASIFFVMMNERSEYNLKVKVAALLAPAVFRTNARSTLYQFSQFVDVIEKVAKWLHIYELDIQGKALNILSSTLCSPTNGHLNGLCSKIFSSYVDIEDDLIDQDLIPLFLANSPAGGSLRTLTHSYQVKNADRFQKYSYGKLLNIKVYGSYYPPEYDIRSAIVPIGIFTGRDDNYVTTEDTNRLAGEIFNLVLHQEVSDPRFSHFDFILATDVVDLLYTDLLAFLDAYP